MQQRAFTRYGGNIALVVFALLFGSVITVIPYLPKLLSMADPFGEAFEKVSSFLIIPGFIVAYFSPTGPSMHDLSERHMVIGNVITWSLIFFFVMRRRRRGRIADTGTQT